MNIHDATEQAYKNGYEAGKKDKWISVKDKLPDHSDDVLCWYEYFRYGNYNRMHQTCGIGYCFNGRWGGEVSNGLKTKVLYWMPLPEPPKED